MRLSLFIFTYLNICNFLLKIHIIVANFKLIRVQEVLIDSLEYNGKIECLTKSIVMPKIFKELNME